MAKQITVVYGYTVIMQNETGDTPDIDQLKEQLDLGDKSGTLFWEGMIVPIGTWEIIDWKAIADELYKELVEGLEQSMNIEAITNYESAYLKSKP